MSPALGEFIGTALLVILGNGVVASTPLAQSKAIGAGWMAITSGWAFGVFGAVLTVGSVSGAHINPARDLGPRLAYALLPLAGKSSPDWCYVRLPVLGPLNGGLLAADTYAALGRF